MTTKLNMRGTVKGLLNLLKHEPLDRTFERYGDFASNGPAGSAKVIFFGNFKNYSYAFAIETDDGELITKLMAAIRANKRRDDYRSQPSVAEQIRQEKARREANLRAIREGRPLRASGSERP